MSLLAAFAIVALGSFWIGVAAGALSMALYDGAKTAREYERRTRP